MRTFFLCSSRRKRYHYYYLFLFSSLCLAILLSLSLSSQAEAKASSPLYPLRPMHAQYDHSEPPANAHLASGFSPAAVRVWFTERVEPGFSRLEVYSSKRERVDLNDSHMLPNDPYSLLVSLRSGLADDAYTVVFHNVSADDGHAVTGGFSFVVGRAVLPARTSNLIPSTQATDTNLNAASVSIRWLNYLGMAGFVGALAFFLLVWLPTSLRLPSSIAKTIGHIDVAMQVMLIRQLLWSLLLLGVGWAAFLVYEAGVVSGRSFWQIWGDGSLGAILTQSRFGSLWLLRLGLLVLAAFLVLLLRWRGNDLLRWLALFVGVVLLYTYTLNSHAAARVQNLWYLLPSDMLHLVSASFWLGGLVALILAVGVLFGQLQPGTGDRSRALAVLIPRFTLLALACVVALLLTGTLQALFLLGSWEAFLSTTYGRVLLVKILLFAVLIGFGAFHGFYLGPHLRLFSLSSDPDDGASSLAAGKFQRTFRSSVRTEALVAALLLVLVGALTSLSPSPPPAQAANTTVSSNAGPLLLKGQAADLTYNLAVSPGKIGPNTFEVQLTTKDGQPVRKADAVLLRFTMLDMNMGVQDLDLEPVAGKPGYYSADGYTLSMTGNWEIDLIVRRPGSPDVKTTLHYNSQS